MAYTIRLRSAEADPRVAPASLSPDAFVIEPELSSRRPQLADEGRMLAEAEEVELPEADGQRLLEAGTRSDQNVAEMLEVVRAGA